ncbi:MAG: hypothetical protein CXT72_05410 [Methanobacteriota archaeon]|jgi:hypothetical protein|nr:MAG: hypothetical protein CXT72_05410 [Euryarchaeota archaeon]HIE63714.1 hypothetical protein [Candidatus Poseidoniales archaeon]HIL00312.1 hypothetical protein [Candidatus Poseidoniales archaeon]
MASVRTLGLALVILMMSTTLTGCLGLAIQRETMEYMREDPIVRNIEDTVGWDYTFESNGIDSVLYKNETTIVFDETVSKLVINFRAQLPYSSSIEDIIGNDTNEYRYVDAKLWQPGVRESGGDPIWHVRATQDQPLERFDSFTKSDYISGNWIFEVEARGYGITAPVDQLSFHDHFDVYATITKPCVYFAESHEIGECTYLSDLQS